MNGRPDAVALISPNNVLANAMLRSVDMVRPRLQATNPDRVAFCVGTQVNGAPHLGTSLVQTAAFLLAKATKRAFGVDTVVRFGALDNAPYDIQLDPETHHAYQQTYFHALGSDGVDDLVGKYYRAMFDSLADATGVDYEIETYTAQQADPAFRHDFSRHPGTLRSDPLATCTLTRPSASAAAMPGVRMGRKARRAHSAAANRVRWRGLRGGVHGSR